MATKMKKLGERNYILISSGVKMCGSYDPDEIFAAFEEELLCSQVDEIYEFLKWVHETGKKFGSGNYEQVFAEYRAACDEVVRKTLAPNSECKHQYGQYRPNGEPGPVCVCADCGVELNVITRKPEEVKNGS